MEMHNAELDHAAEAEALKDTADLMPTWKIKKLITKPKSESDPASEHQSPSFDDLVRRSNPASAHQSP